MFVYKNLLRIHKQTVDRQPDKTQRSNILKQYKMVGTGRVELPTSRLLVVRSNHLSYAPVTLAYHVCE